MLRQFIVLYAIPYSILHFKTRKELKAVWGTILKTTFVNVKFIKIIAQDQIG